VRLEKESFGPVLRAARERKGVTLKQLAAETKLSVELWEGLEENDLSRWPKRVFARSYVRDYALRVGLEADDVVNEFCRLFPEWGDRRAERVLREKAQIISHDLDWEDLPAPRHRRASDRPAVPPATFFGRHRTRMVGAAIDLAVIVWVTFCAVLAGSAFWPSMAVIALVYSVLGSVLVGRSFGLVASDWVVKTVRSMPGTRRLVSSRVESA
jgi:transcriptional regulator with XRE-family HTH domain